jgi:hypothetical protein
MIWSGVFGPFNEARKALFRDQHLQAVGDEVFEALVRQMEDHLGAAVVSPRYWRLFADDFFDYPLRVPWPVSPPE